ncbi:MAG: hypothetical protein QOG99_389 [Frankiales bacterium]|jgi:hypothetical protein|nr:hypothetical protein [Frankiales bacterium]
MTEQTALSRRAKALGIFGTALIAGVVGVMTLQSSSASPSAASNPRGGPPGFQGGPRGGFAGSGLRGPVDALSATSITVGGTTVTVTSATTVIVNGAPGSLADVTKGTNVFVQTTGTGSSRVADRILVGSMRRGGPGGGPGPGQPPGTTTKT